MIEDDLELAQIITDYLKSFDIEVITTDSPYNGLTMLSLNKDYQLIILDLTLPEIDGLELIPKIREKSDIPIIISSARDDILDKVMGLERGADDYLPKPYDPRELEVRIKTILRRFNRLKILDEEDKSNKIFALNEEKREITKNKQYLKLTAAEYEVLSLFIKRESFIVSREDIFENSNIFFNKDYESFGSLAVLINRIRNKIEDNPKKPKYIQTIRGMGYKFLQWTNNQFFLHLL